MSATDSGVRHTTLQAQEDRVLMKHGAGGRAMRRLIEETLAAGFADMEVDGVGLAAFDDGAALRLGDQWLVVTTDSHVVQPAFFPGGDIGRLSVAGTVNDLAMMGATEPLGLTCAVILEEGYPRVDLERVHASMLETAREAGVGPADVHNRDPRELPLLSGGVRTLGDGVLATAQEEKVIFCQLPPWQFDPNQSSNLKRTYRRASFLVTRLLGNLGVLSKIEWLYRRLHPAAGRLFLRLAPRDAPCRAPSPRFGPCWPFSPPWFLPSSPHRLVPTIRRNRANNRSPTSRNSSPTCATNSPS